MRGDETRSGLRVSTAQLIQLANDELGHMSIRRRAEGFTTLCLLRSAQRSRKRLALRLVAALTALVLTLLGLRWFDHHRVSALSYTVESGQVGPGGVIEGTGTTEPRLRFSDGTEVVFLAGSRGQVRSVDEHGARIAVTGKAKVDVVHWRGSHWLFDVGPFLITVKGTAFTAEWNDNEERLEVALEKGTVAVSGPSSDEAITLRAGQRLVVSMRNKEVVIRDINSTADTTASTAVAPEAWSGERPPLQVATARPMKSGHGTAPTAGGPARIRSSAPTWTAELAAGHFSLILLQAEQRGLETTLDEATSDDLAALADAARYSRREDIARRALEAQRRRFGGSARANDAAFLLGRLEETAHHLDVALGWYERCLCESPGGTYMSEALGRKMTVVERLYGASRARPTAEEYLRHFANGTYAAAARALIRPP